MNLKNKSLIIRPETTLDYESISIVNDLAFGQQNEAKLIDKIRNSDRYISELSLVAELEHKIIGYIMFSWIDLVAEKNLKVLALAPLAVLPQSQNQGVGSALVNQGLLIADNQNIPLVIVLGHPNFYAKFGFEPSLKYNIESPFEIPKEVFMVKLLKSYQQDTCGKVVYPSAFNDL
ncbi:GCN5-related N-acetyltransferase [Stanieria cyanosphaera PCC 7437]|uniref:GCN5-related N-acetyltransferase n=1 Tax=Stanieria cyanosphaera (strain ATCC 29371 / PCC 7437) TaxID=111780 RepID=K9XNU3_STAC7|nr:N-acetyltransferase [Stanieria cyanosphaera]AFZ33711.1 GCN5-related N-acetyltransferase [Stanieria cyanosphaera PCC 7437]